jgi:uncharacterized protein (TIGR04551 family)
MLRSLCLAAALSLSGAALAQTAPADTTTPPTAAKKAKPAPARKKKAAPPAPAADAPATSAAPVSTDAAAAAPAPAPVAAAPATPPAPQFDQEEFKRAVMEEVRKELQKTKDEVKQETQWVEQDSQARVQDSEAVENLKTRVNLFQPHGYLRMRGEFFNNLDLGVGTDPSHNYLFPRPYIGTGGNHSQSDANFRFRFEPTLAVSEDISIHFQADMLDNVLLGSDPSSDQYLDPFTPVSALANTRSGSAVNVKRVWGEVNTQLGEFLFGRMGYHWGLGILHNDGNCLDCDYGDTYDRIAFAPREFKGHHFTVMFDLLDKGPSSTGTRQELGRPVDLDTLDDAYRVAVQVTKLDTPEEIKRKLAADQWVLNYGLVLDLSVQNWQESTDANTLLSTSARGAAARRGARFYEPDVFFSVKRKKWRLDAEIASVIGNIDSRADQDGTLVGFNNTGVAANTLLAIEAPVSFLQFGAALQSDIAFLSADALLVGLDLGGASGDKGAYGFGARPWRDGSGTVNQCGTFCSYHPAGQGDIDGSHIDFSTASHTHGRDNSFVFNRAFNVDMILFRNLVTSIASAWYLKPSIRWRPTGRKSGGGDDSGFEVMFSAMYAQAWYAENTPGQAKALGLEFNVGLTYDTTDRFHVGLAYGLLVPFSGLKNFQQNIDPSVAHAVRLITAIPF